jgi:hypothetical protein
MTILLRTAIRPAAAHTLWRRRFITRLLVLALALCGGAAVAQQPPCRSTLRLIRTAQAPKHESSLPQLEPVPPPQGAKKSYRFAPIGAVTLDSGAAPGLLPQDLSAEAFGRQPPMVIAPGRARPWPAEVFCWYGVPLPFAPSYVHRAPGATRCRKCATDSRGDEIPADRTRKATAHEDDKANEIPRPDDGSSRD